MLVIIMCIYGFLVKTSIDVDTSTTFFIRLVLMKILSKRAHCLDEQLFELQMAQYCNNYVNVNERR